MNHKGTMSLVGENIILRRFNLEDVKDAFKNYYNNPLNFKYEFKKEVKTYDELTTIINKKLDNYNRTNYYDYIITLNDNKVVGEVSVPFYNDLLKTIELNLILDRNYNNYAKEILNLIFEFLFEEVNANRIEFKVLLDNENLNNLLLENNIYKEGILREKFLNSDKKLVDCNLYSILRREFNENSSFNSNI